jgi:hypothetical protein
MRAHLSPFLAASPFPAARTTPSNERPVASRITPSHRAHGSNGLALTPTTGKPDSASDDVSLDHREGNRALKNGPGRGRYLKGTGVIREPGGVPEWRHLR